MQILAIVYLTSLANLVADVGTRHSHQILLIYFIQSIENLSEVNEPLKRAQGIRLQEAWFIFLYVFTWNIATVETLESILILAVLQTSLRESPQEFCPILFNFHVLLMEMFVILDL